MSACKSLEEVSLTQKGWEDIDYFPSPFLYFFYKALKGYKTAEDAFAYSQEKTIEWSKDRSKSWRSPQTPQIYDAYPGKMVIAK